MPSIPWYLEHALLLSVPVAVSLLLVTGWLVTFIGSRQSRAQARSRRRALGEPLTDLSPRDEDHDVVVRGRLRVPGAGCLRYEDGKLAAATTMEVSTARTWYEAPTLAATSHRRAEQLRLEVAGRPVVLSGPLAVQVGSLEYWPGTDIDGTGDDIANQIVADAGFDPRECDGFAVYRTVHDGDEVLAAGQLASSRAQEGSTGYRQQALTWRLQPGDELSLKVCAARPPRFRTRRRLLLAGPALLAAAGLVAYVGAFIELDADDVIATCDRPCFLRGECAPQVTWGWVGLNVRCVTGGTPQCEKMRACVDFGRCAASQGACVADSRERCLPTAGCATQGKCTPRKGRCHVGSNQDCAQSTACEAEGLCTAHLEVDPPICGFGADADCEKTADCKLRGLCSHHQGRCVTAKAADCRQSRYCREDGLCSFDAKRQFCIAKDDADCRSSRACKLFRRCIASHDVCRTRH